MKGRITTLKDLMLTLSMWLQMKLTLPFLLLIGITLVGKLIRVNFKNIILNMSNIVIPKNQQNLLMKVLSNYKIQLQRKRKHLLMDPKNSKQLQRKLKIGQKNIKQQMKFLILKFLLSMILQILRDMISQVLSGIKERVVLATLSALLRLQKLV